MKKYIIGFFSLLLVGIGIVLYVWNKPHRTATGETPVALITAVNLFNEFETDEQAALAKYLDKAIQVSGEVVEIIQLSDGESMIMLATSDEMSDISCSMVKGEDVSEINPGMKVAIKGICIGYDMDVQLQQSVVMAKQ